MQIAYTSTFALHNLQKPKSTKYKISIPYTLIVLLQNWDINTLASKASLMFNVQSNAYLMIPPIFG